MPEFYKMMKRVTKDLLLFYLLPWEYRKAARSPIETGYVLFLSTKEATIPESFQVLYERLVECGRYRVQFFSLNKLNATAFEYLRNCIAVVKQVAVAEVVFLDDASDVISCISLRPQTRIVQLWHACGAFKKWGMSTARLKFGGSREDLLRHPFYKNLSLVTVSSPDVSWAYVEAMGLEDCSDIVKPLGVSRTDRFFEDDFRLAACKAIADLIPNVAKKKILLYAPTFRGRVNSAEGPNALDISALNDALGEKYILLIKHHPYVKNPPPVPLGCENFAFRISNEFPMSELLCVADICISDYSSLVFEYSLFSRPMIFFAYDIDEYKDWRGFYYDYDQLTPGPVFQTTGEIIDYILDLEDQFDQNKVKLFREKFMSSCDGRSTDRICKEVFGSDFGHPDEAVKDQ